MKRKLLSSAPPAIKRVKSKGKNMLEKSIMYSSHDSLPTPEDVVLTSTPSFQASNFSFLGGSHYRDSGPIDLHLYFDGLPSCPHFDWLTDISGLLPES